MGTSEPRENGPKRPVEDFEDLLGMVGTKGWKNIFILVMASCAAMIVGLNAVTYAFIGATPKYWCRNEVLSSKTNWTSDQIRNITSPLEIKDKREVRSSCEMHNVSYLELAELAYDDATYTLQEWSNSRELETAPCPREFAEHPEQFRWDLVCERRHLYTWVPTADAIGAFIGAIINGYLSDRFGRKWLYKYCVGVFVICRVLLVISPAIEFYIFLRVVSGVAVMGLYMASFIIVMEFCLSSERTLAGTYFVIPWSLGRLVNSGIAYVVRQWQYLFLIYSAPIVILVINLWVVPESPRWLVINGHHEEAYKELKSIADANKKILPEKAIVIDHMINIQKKSRSESYLGNESVINIKMFLRRYLAPLIIKKIRVQTLLVFYCWFGVAIVYFGVTLDAPGITKSPYLYIFYGGVMEFVSYLLLFPIVHFLGRRIALIVYFSLAAASIFAAMAFLLAVAENDYYELKLTFYLIGKFAISSAFQMIWVWTAEMYPTKLRNLAVAQSNIMARLGFIFSPFINDFLSKIKVWIPAALFATFSLLGIIASYILKDTSNQNLKEFIDEEGTDEDNNSLPKHREKIEITSLTKL